MCRTHTCLTHTHTLDVTESQTNLVTHAYLSHTRTLYITASLRFDGALNVDVTELQTNLVTHAYLSHTRTLLCFSVAAVRRCTERGPDRVPDESRPLPSHPLPARHVLTHHLRYDLSIEDFPTEKTWFSFMKNLTLEVTRMDSAGLSSFSPYT